MFYPHVIEDICFDQDHIDFVWNEMQANIRIYFKKFIDTEAGHTAPDSELEKLAEKFGATHKPKSKPKDSKKILERLLQEAVAAFESDRQKYSDVLNLDALDEYSSDVSSFKNTILRNQIPIITKTLNNTTAKELDKFRSAFGMSQPGELFNVTSNITNLANELHTDWYSTKIFESIDHYDRLGYHAFDSEDYTVYGAIGGGIKSHFIYKLFPEMFPNRSREAVWALYYLTDKKNFNCKEDSEFLMINADEGTTQQNYFYPYGLFAFYALRIFNLIKKLYAEHGVTIPEEYRFVPVDQFLSFVSRSHQTEIDYLKQKSKISHQYEH
ncbi:hypothetical protein [Flavobacterium terrisoli]|uniref:hypothetical protein n=1 Tax=Flavobacterium terrisoli TaxID=3242195 RepID=UPI0025432E25|nr:hypothetical protein [Flavobacterium buctense]